MKTNKLMLPLMAFICAIGMSFTTIPQPEVQTSGEIFRNGAWEPVPVNCNGTGNNCQVKFSSDPDQVYDVYSSTNHSLKLTSNSTEPMLIIE